jgi:hypothetical protein
MPVRIEVEGLEPLQARFRAMPQRFSRALRTTIGAALYVLWENVPPYPEQNPDTDYIRTGTLGRTLGVNETGAKQDKPDIFDLRQQGSQVIGEFGTNLEYAPYVIGDEEQAWMHYRWWRIKDVAQASAAKIERLFKAMAEELARYLDVEMRAAAVSRRPEPERGRD